MHTLREPEGQGPQFGLPAAGFGLGGLSRRTRVNGIQVLHGVMLFSKNIVNGSTAEECGSCAPTPLPDDDQAALNLRV